MFKELLPEAASRLWKDNKVMQEKWIDAVLWLRQHSTKGWVYDKEICKTECKSEREKGYAV